MSAPANDVTDPRNLMTSLLLYAEQFDTLATNIESGVNTSMPNNLPWNLKSAAFVMKAAVKFVEKEIVGEPPNPFPQPPVAGTMEVGVDPASGPDKPSVTTFHPETEQPPPDAPVEPVAEIPHKAEAKRGRK